MTLFSPHLLGAHTLGSAIRGHGASAEPGRGIVLRKAGRCPQEPTLLIKLFDNSGSVTFGNDAIGNRYVEARVAVDKIARRCRCGQELCCIVHFDTPTSGDIPPTPMRKNMTRIAAGLHAPSDGYGISELGRSLTVAKRVALRHPEHKVILVVFSDFELFDPNLEQLYEDMASFPDTTHAVVLRARPPQQLVDDDRVIVTAVNYDSQSGTVAHAVFDALTTYRPGRSPRAFAGNYEW